MIRKYFIAALVALILSFLPFQADAQETSGGFSGGSIKIGYDSRACVSGLAGSIRYNTSTSCAEYCNGSAWTCPASGYNTGGGVCPEGATYVQNPSNYATNGVWSDGTYVYGSDATTLYATTFTTGGGWNLVTSSATLTDGDNGGHIWGDGTYIYVADGSAGLRAYTFNGTAFTLAATYNSAGTAISVWGDGTYLYLADNTAIRALSFNGSTFTLIASATGGTNIARVWAAGGYIYYADTGANRIRAYTFNGTAFTLKATYTISQVLGITGDGTYIYTTGQWGWGEVLTFDGSAFTHVADFPYSAWDLVTKNGFIYAATGNGLQAFKFDGTSIRLIATYPSYLAPRQVAVDNSYVYEVDNTYGVGALTLCSDTDSSPNAFDFTDSTSAALNSLILSNIIMISGIDTSASVTITGAGSPEYRTCSDSSCSTVIQNWGAGVGSISNAQYIQVRLTSAALPNTQRLANPITIGGVSADWSVTTLAAKMVFATSTTYDGSLGGKTGANNKCATQATAGGLSGTFKAWLATSATDDPESDFAQAAIPYVTVTGVQVADNWSDLTDGTVDNAISVDENGNAVTGAVWTNVATDGSQKQDFPASCSDFTSNNGAATGFKGLSTSATATWTDNSSQACSAFSRLYCFEQ